MFKRFFLLPLALLLTLSACTGGDSSSSSGAAAGVVGGTVTGLASVVVDGVEIEDASASVRRDNHSGGWDNTSLQLGQRVRVHHNGRGTASQITVEAAVIGTVSAISGTTLTVAGQSVVTNATNTALPITYYGGGLTAVGDIAVGNIVEVHGSPSYDSATQTYKVQATRIEKLSTLNYVRVMGVIASLNPTAKTFAINGLTVNYGSATSLPSALADGQNVVAFGGATSLVGTTLTATRVRLYSSTSDTSTAAPRAQLSGLVSQYNSSTKTFVLGDTTISMGAVTPTPSGVSVANGAYVAVEGTVNASGGIDAASIKVRQANTSSDLAKVLLIGPISAYDATNATLVVRSVPVDLDGINIATSCPGVTFANDLQVRIEATVQSGTDVVLATKLVCAQSTGTVVWSYAGTASSVNDSAKTFVLSSTDSAGTVTTKTIQWNDNTAFRSTSSTTLTTGNLVVEGYTTSAGVLIAKSVRLQSALAAGGDRYRGSDSGTQWNNYRSKKPKGHSKS